MKNAKEREDEIDVENVEIVEDIQQETTNDIPVDIVEDSEGNYASM